MAQQCNVLNIIVAEVGKCLPERAVPASPKGPSAAVLADERMVLRMLARCILAHYRILVAVNIIGRILCPSVHLVMLTVCAVGPSHERAALHGIFFLIKFAEASMDVSSGPWWTCLLLPFVRMDAHRVVLRRSAQRVVAHVPSSC